MSNTCLSILVAMAENRVIGHNNTLPWHLPEDLKRFKALTMGCPIIMGRKTYESIGRPLPGRTNIVITRQNDYPSDGLVIAHSIESAIKVAEQYCGIDRQEIFIIGGEELFRQTLHLCHKLYLTEIQKTFEGDTFFPEFDLAEWDELAREEHYSEAQQFAYCYVDLVRKTKGS